MEPIIKLAIADDHEIVRKGVIEIINGFGGFSIEIEAGNGRELYDKILAADTLPDIVITDVSMPEWDGYEAVDAIKKQWPDMKVLVFTMHKHEFAIIRMFKSGASGYLLKNTQPKELKKALISIHETGFYFSEVASANLYHRLQHSNIIPFLTEKEIQMIRLCHTDLTYDEIAKEMNVTERSVAGMRKSLFDKLAVNSRGGLVFCAIQMGLLQG